MFMFNSKKSVPLLLILVFALLNSRCAQEESSTVQNSPLVVVVAGDGVPPLSQTDRLFPLNRAQGKAMYEGASAALHRSPHLRGLSNLVAIEGYDDAGRGDLARSIAKQLVKRPIIAVIGHAESETTRQAAGIYASAGIPLLMPIATSPTVMYPLDTESETGQRITNAFRLPPADDIAQAPALTYLLRKLKAKKLFLIEDISNGAEVYSASLAHALQPLLKQIPQRQEKANREITDFLALARSIRAEGSDTIVFCGYGSTAIELLNALRNVYSDVAYESRPKVILTDGCLIPDLNTSGLNVYLTFPHIELRQPATPEDQKDVEIINETFKATQKISYELFGYDAMLILGEAIKSCLPKGVNRECIRKQLSRPRGFLGTAGNYQFENGENRMAQYDILWNSPPESSTFDPKSSDIVNWNELMAIRAETANESN